MHFVLGARGSKGAVANAQPADKFTRVEGILPCTWELAMRVHEGKRTAFASVHLPPAGGTRETVMQGLGQMTVAVSWMEDSCGKGWGYGRRLERRSGQYRTRRLGTISTYRREGEKVLSPTGLRAWLGRVGVPRLGT